MLRATLDAALADRGVCLPCAGTGSLGGLFASDPIGATNAGSPSPRSLLLGIEAALADGTEFRSGARVVKSVAGFDLHKLFVGSSGRLFVVSKLHLKLRPAPRAAVWFERQGLALAPALSLFRRLRTEAAAPTALHLHRDANEYTIRGRFEGHAAFVHRALRTFELSEGPEFHDLHLDAPAGGEVLVGVTTPGQASDLLDAAPADASFLLHGGGRFELASTSTETSDGMLHSWTRAGVHACVALGSSGRRGHGTPLDDGQRKLQDGLTRALDPHGILV